MGFFDNVGGFFSNLWDSPVGDAVVNAGIGAATGGVAPTPSPATGGGFWHDVSSSIASPTGLSALLTGGLGLYSNLQEDAALKRQEEQAALDRKNQLLLEIAKAKAGGGGGSAAASNLLAANNAIIAAVKSGVDEKQGALNSWASNYLRAYGK